MYKPGYRTSEFWFTLVSFIFSGLYLVGLISENDQKEELISSVSHAVESCILIGGQFAILYKYINSRKESKKDYEENKKTEEKIDEPIKPRTNKSRSRKPNKSSSSKSSGRKKTSSKRSVENSTSNDSKHNTNSGKTRKRSKQSGKEDGIPKSAEWLLW